VQLLQVTFEGDNRAAGALGPWLETAGKLRSQLSWREERPASSSGWETRAAFPGRFW
jgi:hypothetical protein